jgi:hypothetical protein
MKDIYDTPPSGYFRSSDGWLKPYPNPIVKQLKLVKKENAVLKETLTDVLDRLVKLEGA